MGSLCTKIEKPLSRLRSGKAYARECNVCKLLENADDGAVAGVSPKQLREHSHIKMERLRGGGKRMTLRPLKQCRAYVELDPEKTIACIKKCCKKLRVKKLTLTQLRCATGLPRNFLLDNFRFSYRIHTRKYFIYKGRPCFVNYYLFCAQNVIKTLKTM